jgi:hypothetical protein
MFIYRDEYYNPETTEKQGTAEIHIAKHRNGPAGTHVELSFLSRFPKFANIARMERPVVQSPGEGPPLAGRPPVEAEPVAEAGFGEPDAPEPGAEWE